MTSDAGVPGAPRFDVVLRGYDRRQVDEHVDRLQRVLARMRADLDVARSQPMPVVSASQPMRPRPTPRPRPGGQAGDPDTIGTFTDRMESILAAAEEEAAEIRRNAHRAARAETEGVRAQVADLIRQRDAVLAELTRMRSQLEGLLAAPTAAMPAHEPASHPLPGRRDGDLSRHGRPDFGPRPAGAPPRPAPGAPDGDARRASQPAPAAGPSAPSPEKSAPAPTGSAPGSGPATTALSPGPGSGDRRGPGGSAEPSRPSPTPGRGTPSPTPVRATGSHAGPPAGASSPSSAPGSPSAGPQPAGSPSAGSQPAGVQPAGSPSAARPTGAQPVGSASSAGERDGSARPSGSSASPAASAPSASAENRTERSDGERPADRGAGTPAGAAITRASQPAQQQQTEAVRPGAAAGAQNGRPQNGPASNGQPQNGQLQNGQPQNGQPQNGQPQNGQPQNGQPQAARAQSGDPRPGGSPAASPAPDVVTAKDKAPTARPEREAGKAAHRLPTGAYPAVNDSGPSMRPRSAPEPEPADLFRPAQRASTPDAQAAGERTSVVRRPEQTAGAEPSPSGTVRPDEPTVLSPAPGTGRTDQSDGRTSDSRPSSSSRSA